MNRKSLLMRTLGAVLAILLALPVEILAQQEGGTAAPKKQSREELAQLLAPIALYPDELVAQILMASTYPLEIVQADRWVQQNKGLKGDALGKALEKQSWDPSVKSLVNFPDILSAMSQKLELTSSVGDAYLAQPKDVMDTIQDLRKKAKEAGNLKSSKEQKVVVQQETIVIKPADPQVIYVPTYSPTVVYGAWPYPAYPPYAYYPPPPPAYPAFTLAAGVAVGMAWGYAWGNCNWHGGSVNYNVNQNINVNNNINRAKYQAAGGGKGTWRHNPAHRGNVAYRDGATARKYGQSRGQSSQRRADARGYSSGRGAGGGAARPAAGTTDRGARGGADRSAGARGGGDRGAASRSGAGGSGSARRDSAFSGSYGSGRQVSQASSRGQASRQSAGGFSGSTGRAGGGFGGGGFRGGGGRGGRR